MKKGLLIKNASVVTPGGIIEKCGVRSRDGKINKIGRMKPDGTETVIDAKGNFLIPGFIDLHSDCIEKEVEQRPGSTFPTNISIIETDKKNISSGVTTAYYSLSFTGDEMGLRSNKKAKELTLEIVRLRKHLSADSRIHARFEITNTAAIPIIEELINMGVVDLVSIMDHTPGQGQFKTNNDYINYYGKKYMKNNDALSRTIEKKIEVRANRGEGNINRMIKMCTENSIPMASHDDDSEVKIKYLKARGISISEFPVNLDAAKSAKKEGLYVMLGAPNIVRGHSHLDNLSGLDAIRKKCGSVICSDYMVTSILHAVFKLAQLKLYNLSDAVNFASLNPAKAVKLDGHKGSIETGKDADIVIVNNTFEIPIIEKVFIKGEKVYERSSN